MIRNKLNINLYILLIFIVGSTSCTEIIRMDINDSDPQIVVEASIGQGEYARVVLTESVNLYSQDEFPGITGAIVKLTDNEGNTETLTPTNPGVYVSTELIGKAGRTYYLDIEKEEKSIIATSTIPSFVPIDTFRVVNSIYPGGGPAVLPNQTADFYEVYVTYNDPVNESNYYRIVLYVNDIPQNRNYINDDRLTNGNRVENLLVVYNPELKQGDKIMVEMMCIDKPVYEYFKSMGSSSSGPSNSSSPANPYTNLNGTILGFFSAHTIERRVFIIQ